VAAKTRSGLLMVIGPGLLVAATGVGAGGLATAAFTGNPLGLAVPWAVVLGALFMLLLAFALLILNGRSDWVGQELRNRPITAIVPMAAVLFPCDFPLPRQDDLWYPLRGCDQDPARH